MGIYRDVSMVAWNNIRVLIPPYRRSSHLNLYYVVQGRTAVIVLFFNQAVTCVCLRNAELL